MNKSKIYLSGFMKRFFINVSLSCALAGGVWAQTTNNFVNIGNITAPTQQPIPQIDATNFSNFGLFNLALTFNAFSTNVGVFNTIVVNANFLPYDFTDVLTYSNRGIMTCDTGFLFNTQPSGSGSAHRASVFGNANLGSISAGSFSNIFTSSFVFFGGALPSLKISATNVVNAGLLDVGVDGNLSLDGENLNLSRGTMTVEGLAQFGSIFVGGQFFGASLSFGIVDNYYGLGLQTNAIAGGNYTVNNAFSPSHNVTTSFLGTGSVQLVLPPTAIASANVVATGPSNIFLQLVLVNTNAGISTSVRYEGAGSGFQVPVIEWYSTVTNNVGAVTTNTLYLTDVFGARTNFAITTNGLSQSFQPLIAPFNYSYTTAFPNFSNLPAGNFAYDQQTFFANALPETNQFSAYGVTVSPMTFQPDPNLPGQTLTNIPGRISINADKVLDLTRSIINGPNYLKLNSTNHFVGSTNAQIGSPNMDINLGSTNGNMNVSNLVVPYLARLNGPIEAYSARWTNIVAGITNNYHILIVESGLIPIASPLVQNFLIRSTNVIISDAINVASNVLINARNVTITTNGPFAQTPIGQLNLQGPNIVWSSSFPVLQNLTNFGFITSPNAVYFAGARQNPYFSSNFTEPYLSFINHGVIQVSGASIWASNFQNTGDGTILTNLIFTSTNLSSFHTNGLIVSTFGPINIQATTATLTNGALVTSFAGGDIGIKAGSLLISNHALNAVGALNLTITNVLTDTGTNASNFWTVADGIDLPIKPLTGDLLGTTISSTSPANLEVDSVWAGADRGPNATGFLNNAAIGHLILDGGNAASVFYFSGPNAQNALYVDLIELKNGATNRATKIVNGQQQQVYTALDIASGMTVYFADAMANGLDISEALNQTVTESGGVAIWVPSYTGFFSGTNITYPSGLTYAINRGLALSQDIDSDGDGTVNANDSTPVFEGESLNVKVSLTNSPAKSTVISWQTLAGATNNLFSTTNITGGNWTLVTNFVSNANGRVAVTNGVQTAVKRYYYKVRVDPLQP